jgi:hypothetical protein
VRYKVRPAPAHFRAAGLAIERWRYDPFTTLATLTMNVLAAERQVWPAPQPPAPLGPKNKLEPSVGLIKSRVSQSSRDIADLQIAGLGNQTAVFGQTRPAPLEINDALEPSRVVRIC